MRHLGVVGGQDRSTITQVKLVRHGTKGKKSTPLRKRGEKNEQPAGGTRPKYRKGLSLQIPLIPSVLLALGKSKEKWYAKRFPLIREFREKKIENRECKKRGVSIKNPKKLVGRARESQRRSEI